MGLVLDKCCTNKDFHALSTVSDNPNFFYKDTKSGDVKNSSIIKTSADSLKRGGIKKKIKFSDSYVANMLENMDESKTDIMKEICFTTDGKRRVFFSSPYLKSKMIKEDIRKIYKIGNCLGTGQFGSVRIGTPYANPEKKFAIKSMPRKANEDYIRQLEKEFRILKEVNHPNIIKFYEAYQDQKYFHFVIEYCDGGELFDVITKRGSF